MIEKITCMLHIFGIVGVLFNMIYSIWNSVIKHNQDFMTKREYILTILVLVLVGDYLLLPEYRIIALLTLLLFLIYSVIYFKNN